MIRYFILPTLLASLALAGIYYSFGTTAFLTALLLSVLEITLSFDNAVVNAKVLKRMSPAWQKSFLTWGMLTAVVGVRFLLPVLIVSVTAFVDPWTIAKLAVFDGAAYGALLTHAAPAIHAFGAAFLTMVALKYFLDENKTVHWIHVIESGLSKWGRVESLEIAATLMIVGAVALLVPHEEALPVLFAGIVGIIVSILMEGITAMFDRGVATGAAVAGLSLFIYLNILDAAFSLDSVVGAFALTTLIPSIVVGLGIGAYFVRSMTLYLVEKKTLDSLQYLEHGAHWAIFGLAASMFVSLVAEVPEIVTGSIGLVFVLAAYYSSLVARRGH